MLQTTPRPVTDNPSGLPYDPIRDLYGLPLTRDILQSLRSLAATRPEHDTLIADMLARFAVPLIDALLASQDKLEGTPQ